MLRLRFRPLGVTAGAALAERQDLTAEGYVIQPLGGGDYAIRIRHDRSRRIRIDGLAKVSALRAAVGTPLRGGRARADPGALQFWVSAGGCAQPRRRRRRRRRHHLEFGLRLDGLRLV